MADRRFTDNDPMNDLMDERMAGGAGPSSGALTKAPAKFFDSNLGGQQGSWITNYKNPGGPITTNVAGSAKIPGPADFSSYAKVTPGGIPGLTKGQMYFPYSHSTATNMDMYGNPVTIGRMPGWADLAAGILGAGALGSLFNRSGFNPSVTDRMGQAGGNPINVPNYGERFFNPSTGRLELNNPNQPQMSATQMAGYSRNQNR